MRSSLKSLIAVATAFLVAPSFASADDVGSGNDMQEVLSRMSDLEQQLKATNDALAASNAKVEQQQKMISKLGTSSNQSAPMLALSNFLTETTFAGWVSVSHFYNTNKPDSGRTMGANSGTIGANPYHPNSNSFQVDQVWFSMNNEATPESRAGFQVDIVYGETADRLSSGFEANTLLDYLFNANVSYLAPITDAGIKITAGRFEKHIGTESTQDPRNFNITRGLLYTLQPINFTGVKVSSKYDSGLDWMVGVSNNSGYSTLDTNPYAFLPNAHNYDTDNSKVLLWRVGYQVSDQLSVAFNGLYGGDCATSDPSSSNSLGAFGGCGITIDGTGRMDTGNHDRQIVLDLTGNWDPSDKLSTWVDFDYMAPTNDRRSGKPYLIGVAAAGRYQVTDHTGAALRLEYLYSHDNYIGLAVPINPATILSGTDFPGIMSPTPGWYYENQDIWSVTATLDHKLTDHLTAKAEVVYQEGNSENNTDNQYFCDEQCNSSWLDRRQVLIGAQLTYEF